MESHNEHRQQRESLEDLHRRLAPQIDSASDQPPLWLKQPDPRKFVESETIYRSGRPAAQADSGHA